MDQLKNRKIPFPPSQKWLWKLAWNDAKFNLGRLFLFVGSIIIGVAGLTAISGFNDNLQQDIDAQAKELLGADLAIENDDYSIATADSVLSFLQPMASDSARDAQFASMVYFPKSRGSRLVQVVALKGNFPFYGTIEARPASSLALFRQGNGSLIDEALARQYGVSVGDTLKLGEGAYPVGGIVTRFPGNTDIRSAISPRVYLPYDKLKETGLIQYGSRVEYHYYYKLNEAALADALERLEELENEFNFRLDTVAEEKEDMSRGFQNLYRYFNLLSFVALILGSIGVASSVYVYMREKRNSAAVLRCVGAQGWQVFWLFFLQIIVLGFLGSLLGVLFGIGIQYGLPLVVSDFLPMEVNVHLSWGAVFSGLLAGMLISVLFSALPLADMRFVSPLEVLRRQQAARKVQSRFRIMAAVAILLFPFLFAVYLSESWLKGGAFYLGLAVAFLSLYFISKGLIWVVKYLMPSGMRFSWKLGFSNLFRPNNQTAVLVIVIGLGAFLIATMALIQNSLLSQVEFVGSGERSNTVLFDIQPYQQEEVVQLVKEYDAPVQQLVPIVTMRIKELKGETVESLLADTSRDLSRGRLTREYRVTYRDSLIASEKLLKGEFTEEQVQEGDSIFISVSEDMAERLQLELKDPITFDVQGVPMTTYVGSVREVDWQRIQTNFMVVFPSGVLEQAPQFYVVITRMPDKQQAARFQQALVQQFPNVSLIDLNLILETLDQIFDKIAFVIRFMAMFSILTGMLVLSAAVMNSRFARLRENVMLRTIGAMRRQIVGMTLIEYGYLGTFAGLSGILLALLGSWVLARFFFEITFFPDLLSLLLIWVLVAGATVLIGWLNTRSVLNRSPLEVLRKEA